MLYILALGYSSAQDKELGILEQNKSDVRTISIYAGVGFLELMAIGVQYQFSEYYSLGLKGSIIFERTSKYFILPSFGTGGGLKFSYFFDQTGKRNLFRLNVINVEAAYLNSSTRKNAQQVAHSTGVEATIGHDSINDAGFGIIWAMGFAVTTSKGEAPLISPALKVGVHLNI